MNIWNSLKCKFKTLMTPNTPSAPAISDAQRFLQLMEQYYASLKGRQYYYDIQLSTTPQGKAILALDADGSLRMLLTAISLHLDGQSAARKFREQIGAFVKEDPQGALKVKRACQEAVIRGLLKRKLPFEREHIIYLASWLLFSRNFIYHQAPVPGVVFACENYISQHGIDDEITCLLKEILTDLIRQPDEKRYRRVIGRLKLLLGEAHEIPLNAGEAWSDAALRYLDKHDGNLGAELLSAWNDLLNHCQSSDGGKPSKKWIKKAEELIEPIGLDNLLERSLEWFVLVDRGRTRHAERSHAWSPDPNLMLDDANADVLKGLVWCCAFKEDAQVARNLVKLGLSCYKKVPGLGPRAVRVGNACIYALSNMPGRTGLFQLAVLKVKVKYRSALKLMNKALQTAAKREGVGIEELEEMGVPSYGLETVGRGEESVGDFTAMVEVPDIKTVVLKWRKFDGKIQKSVPKAVKTDYSKDLKEIRGTIKDIKAMISVQKDRIEQLFLREANWDYRTWRERYLNHPIVGILARSLIWRFNIDDQSVLAVYGDGDFVDHDGKQVLDAEQAQSVSLWHPITSSVDEIKNWRERIQAMQIVQPFKQAHREVYLLTDAERSTEVYSNRFASHLIKQHQFNALAGARGWRYSLQGAWDGGDDVARLPLDRYRMWAEFWVYGIGEYGDDTTEAGIFKYVSTDQVRFYSTRSAMDEIDEAHINEQTPVPLSEVPALVLSEVLRDVDLFVGVCSVGNDPEWSDGGVDGRYRDYWHTFSFGELSASAQTRKEILENLIPKLKIADQCRFVDRFLVVEGSRRVYKIHLGSGNILMEPNNQYLCIVTDKRQKSARDKVFLPFEGDNTLSVIISKALLLADDKKIKDTTINSQIDSYK